MCAAARSANGQPRRWAITDSNAAMMAHRRWRSTSRAPARPGPADAGQVDPTALAGLGDGPRRNRDHADRAPTAPRAELYPAGHEREEGVVATAADADAWVKVRAALAHEDLARVDDLAAIPLYAEPLGIGVTPVPAGRGALLVSHLSVTFLRPSSSGWRWPCQYRCR